MKNKNFRRIFGYMNRVKKYLAIGFFWLALATAFRLYSPMVIEKILDEQVMITGIADQREFIKLLILYAVINAFGGIFRYISTVSFHRSANKAAIYMREDVFRHVQKLPISYFDNLNAGKIVSRITNDTDSVKALFQTVLSQFVTSFVFILSAIIILAIREPWAVLFCIVPIPVLYFAIAIYHKYSLEPNREYRRSISQANSDINENIRGIGLIKTYNVEDEVKSDFENLNSKIFNLGFGLEKLDALLGYNIIGKARMLNTALILFVFGFLHLEGNSSASIGFMFVVLDYTMRIYGAAQQVMNRFTQLEKSVTSAEHIFEVLDYETERDDGKNESEIFGNVEYKNLCFSYIEDVLVLKDINFKVNSGETVALVGHTGSGKSSIINLIFGFYEKDSGEILIDNIPIEQFSKQTLRKQMAVVLQDPYIFKGTVYENVTLFEDYPEEKVIEALIRVGGENLLKNLEKGIHTELSDSGSTISAGERQIITFARALIRNPKILVLDEATASIDSETEDYIQRGFEALKSGRTTFIIAHRLSTIKNADMIYVLDNGKICERGNHEELTKLRGRYYNMLLKEQN
ncbi:MAG: ABC transporter ATP-binding protein [Tissierellia bacterium]|nr:ABC transporter ATP-binding protein [Tissierellia bacterium]